MILTAEGNRVRVLAPAKVNLFLEVLDRRPDAFHEIDTVFQAVTLYDRLTAVPALSLSLVVHPGTADVPLDDTNLVLQAARALAERTGAGRGARLVLEKEIPTGAGLGGGSSDAAAALVALEALWGTSLDRDDLLALAGGLGSDVAFFIRGGTSRGRGRGERLDRIVTGLILWYVIIWPDTGLSTAEAYRRLDERQERPRPDQRSADDLIRALQAGDARSVGGATFNRFEEAATESNPRIRPLLDRLRRAGALAARLAGSGSAVFGVFDREQHAEAAANHLRDVTGGAVWVARTEITNDLLPPAEGATPWKSPKSKSNS